MSTIAKRSPLFAVPGIDLSRLTDLAFGTAPDHPLHSQAEVQKMIAALPADPVAALAELAHQAVSINQTASFNSSQRVRILMTLDVAAHDCWNRIWKDYFAPHGVPAEGREVGGMAFRPLLEIAAQFSSSFASGLEGQALEADWVMKNLGQIMLRRALWLGRKFVLMNMLHHPSAGAIWEEAHSLCLQAYQHGVLEIPLAVPGDDAVTSIKQEYVRLFMAEIAGLDTLHGREIDLVFRIAGRLAAQAQLRPEPIPGALYAVVPSGTSKPISVRRLDKSFMALYLDTTGCLAPLKALFARGLIGTPSDPDPLFNKQFTMRESCDMAARLIDYWGANPPKRRSQRVALDMPIKVRRGFDSVVQAIAPLDQGAALAAEATAAVKSLPQKRSAEASEAAKEAEARLVDASVAGLGVLVPRKDAAWARLGTLLAIYMEPGPDWIVGVLRRITAEGQMLRLGIGILGRRARCGWFHLRSSPSSTIAGHEARKGEDFLTFYRPGIFLDIDMESAATGEILIPRDGLKLGSRLELPLEHKVQHLSPTGCESTTGFDTVAFEMRSASPYPVEAKQSQEEPDPWKNAN